MKTRAILSDVAAIHWGIDDGRRRVKEVFFIGVGVISKHDIVGDMK